MCKSVLPQTCFAAKQARRAASHRKCRRCVENWSRDEHASESHSHAIKKLVPAAQQSLYSVGMPPSPEPLPANSVVDCANDPLRQARKAETVLRGRTERVCLILEHCCDDLNHVAVLRTCDAMGVMRVWLVEAERPAVSERERRKLTSRAAQRGLDCDALLGFRRAQLYAAHLDVRTFRSTSECVAAARADGRALWVTDLGQSATPLCAEASSLAAELPARVAVVVGSESAGVSAEMLAAADRRVFLPMYGFAESYNLAVAAALVLQRLLDACPESRGRLSPVERDMLRRRWYDELARSPAQRAVFAALADQGGAPPFVDTRRPEQFREEGRRFAANAAQRPARRAKAAAEREKARKASDKAGDKPSDKASSHAA